jgi:hypothetical protein
MLILLVRLGVVDMGWGGVGFLVHLVGVITICRDNHWYVRQVRLKVQVLIMYCTYGTLLMNKCVATRDLYLQTL